MRLALLAPFAAAAPLLAAALAAQPAWTPLTPGAGPSARTDHALGFDPARGELLLYGGWDGALDLADTWTWDGTAWSQRTPATSPGPRSSYRFAPDPGRGRMMLFGGWDGSGGPANDTWEWDGVTWAQRVTTTQPSPRASYAMAYDAARNTTILFGGFCGGSSTCALGDTWAWDGSGWTQLNPSQSPAPRFSAAMAFDAARGALVLYGGSNGRTRYSDTWTWDGSTWQPLSPAANPGPRSAAGVAYDALRQRTVLFGGFTGARYTAQTWEWDGSDWQQRAPSPVPAARGFMAMVYDPLRGETALHGGGAGSLQRADLWSYQTNAVAGFVPFGQGCGGIVAPTLQAATGARPWAGSGFDLALDHLPVGATVGSVGSSNTAWGALALPFDLGPLGAPGCAVLTSLEVVLPVPLIGGRGTWTLPVPATAALAGVPFHVQVFAASAPANPLGIAATNAGTGTVGVR